MDRARILVEGGRIRILTGAHLLDPFREALGELDPSSFLVEPRARGTGPVLAWAAWTIAREDPDAVLISLHADHHIGPLDAFRSLMLAGAETARTTDALFTVAVPPTRPETGYGYIRPDEPLPSPPGTDAFRVQSFVEKPDRDTATRYIAEGYLWNSGIFLWRASVFLQEVRAVTPEIGSLFPLLEEGKVAEFFQRVPSISVDEGVLERSSRVAALRATFRWDDVGAWESLSRTRSLDGDGNVLLGSVHARDARGNIVMTEAGTVVLFGVDNLVVVQRGDVVLVVDRGRTPDLKTLLQSLPEHLRDPE